MSIIRLSCVHSQLFAPEADGTFVSGDYNPATRTGRIADFARDDSRVEDDKSVRSKTIDDWLDAALPTAAGALGADAPVLVMVHGFLFDPKIAIDGDPAKNDNPHGRIFHFQDKSEDIEIREHSSGWPLQLGLAPRDRGKEGLSLAFGWYSHPGFASSLLSYGKNFYARAYANAREAAWPLACVIDSLRRKLRGRPIDIVCHSLGSAAVVRALAIAAKFNLTLTRSVGRVVFLGGSEYTGEARLMYKRVGVACAALGVGENDGPQFYNVVSRENAVLDLLAENFGPRSFFSDSQVIGHNGLQAPPQAPRWIDLQIDSGALRAWAMRNGFSISGDQPDQVWDHWYYYTHRGNMRFYTWFLRDRAATALPALRRAGIAEGVATSFLGD